MKVKIEAPTRIGQGSKVYFNGEQVKCISRLNLSLGINEANTVQVTLIPDSIDFEGYAEIIATVSGVRYRLIELKRGDPFICNGKGTSWKWFYWLAKKLSRK